MRPAPARRTAASDATESDTPEALRCFGLALLEPEPESSPQPPQPLEVCPGNERAVQLFLACQRYWHLTLGGMGGAHWSAVPPGDVRQVMDWQGIKRKEQGALWQQYTLMEQEALSIVNQRQA